MKKRHIITIAAIVSLVLLYLVFLIAPQRKAKNEIMIALAETEKKVSDYIRIMLEFPGFFKTQQDLLQKKKILVSKLYSKDDLIKLFDRIQRKSLGHNLTLVEISPSVDELLELNRKLLEDDKPQPLDIAVRLRGNLRSAGLFIKDIEAEDFFNGINYCRISNYVLNQQFSDISFGFKAILGTIKDS